MQLSGGIGGVVAGKRDPAIRSASTSNFGATAESLIQIKGRSAPAVHAPAGASAACWYYSRAHNPPLNDLEAVGQWAATPVKTLATSNPS